MNDLADEGFHEIQLSGKQLVFLFMATTILAVLIFLCGVQVGRGVRPERGIETADAAAAATPPPAAATPSQPAAAGGPPAAEPPAPAPEPEDELSYAKRLQSDQSKSPAEKLKSPSAAAQASAAKAVPPPAEPRAAAPAPRSEPAAAKPPAKAEPSALAQTTGRPGGWIVQITALQDRGACATIAQRLASKGYPAFVLDPAPGSPKIYRVQVGGYPDRDKAEQAARRLATEEQFKTYVRSR
jgi:outer membrane biosynthesis protein TonB